MSFTSSTTPRAAKGQLKCFQCRQSCAPKDGNWRNLDNRQIFLCKKCEKTVGARKPS